MVWKLSEIGTSVFEIKLKFTECVRTYVCVV